MTETIEKAETVEQAEEKRYTFRKLSSTDIFLMLKIFGKIGVKELKNCFKGDSLDMLINAVDKNGVDGKAVAAIGVAIGFDGVDIILNNLPKCEQEIYQLLAQVANESVTVDEIKADALLFMEMLVDFVKKEEFPAFFAVVSRSFK
jgi:hypothetical protein